MSSSYDDILRLAQLATGATAGPLPPAPSAVGPSAAPPAAAASPPAGAPPAAAPTGPPAGPAAETPYSPGNAAPGDIHALSRQTMGPQSLRERIARTLGMIPGFAPIDNLVQAGSQLISGSSGYSDIYNRHSLDALQAHLDEQARLQKAEDLRNRLRERAGAVQAAMKEAGDRQDMLVSQREAARNAGTLSQESEAGINDAILAERQKHAKLSTSLANILADPNLADDSAVAEDPSTGLPKTAADAVKRHAMLEAAGTAAGKPDANADPNTFIDYTHYGQPVMDLSDVNDKVLATRMTIEAKKRGLPVIDKDKAGQLKRIGDASNNYANLISQASLFLPDKPLNVVGSAQEFAKQFTDDDVSSYKAFRLTAIPLVQAAATLGTGNRVTIAELTTALHNAFPTLPIEDKRQPLGDWKGSAAGKAQVVYGMLENARKAVLGDAGAQDDLVNAIHMLAQGKKVGQAPASVETPSAKPAAAPAPGAAPAFDPASLPGMEKSFDPASLPGMTKTGTTVKQHQRRLKGADNGSDSKP